MASMVSVSSCASRIAQPVYIVPAEIGQIDFPDCSKDMALFREHITDLRFEHVRPLLNCIDEHNRILRLNYGLCRETILEINK